MEYGYIIADRYICRKPLGKGSNGSVFLCFDQKINKFWAIKECLQLSKREIYALKSINHYAFPRIVDVISQDNAEYIVMDYIEGETLSSYCRHHTLDEKQVIRWGYKIASALSYLHNMNPPVFYVDCKPDNIIITPSKDLRIIDLGSIYIDSDKSSEEIDSDISSDATISGSRFYTPEELSYSTPNVSTDIYCLGMTLYRILTGTNIEYRDTKNQLCPEHVNKNLSYGICQFIKHCTCKNPRKRFQSMSDAADHLNKLSQSKQGKFRKLSSFFRYAAKIFLSIFILYIAYAYKTKVIYPVILLFITLLLLSQKPAYSTWETKKIIIKGAVTTLSILILLFTAPDFKSFAKKDVPETERLDITLYDEYSRKLLVRPGSIWEVNDDIVLSLSTDNLSSDISTITILCESDSQSRSYTFNCRYTENK